MWSLFSVYLWGHISFQHWWEEIRYKACLRGEEIKIKIVFLSFVFHKPGVLIAKFKGHLASRPPSSSSMWCWCNTLSLSPSFWNILFLSINCGVLRDGERCLLPYTLWYQTQHKDGLRSFVPEEEDVSRQPRFTSVREKATTGSKCTLQTGRADTAERRGPRSASCCLNHLITGVWEWQPE